MKRKRMLLDADEDEDILPTASDCQLEHYV